MEKLNQFLDAITREIINPIILPLAGVAFVVFIWGIFEFIMHAADEKKREDGRRAILWGLVGLVIIFGVYGLLNLVLGTFGLPPIERALGQ